MKKSYNYPRFGPDVNCRFCGHTALWHMIIKDFGTKKMKGRWGKCSRYVPDCDCKGFAPKDNLTYLEMKHEEKEISA